MGSNTSAVSDTPGGDLRLPASGLRFTSHQLRSLNSYVDTLYEEDQKGRMSVETEMMVEALVQRIVDGAGQRDPRFRCSHLIALHRGKRMRSKSLEYLVTIDSLPILNVDDEGRLQEGPVGFGKVRLAGRQAETWAEFLTPAGYLCRDKVVERWVQLVARCARARGGGALRVLSARAHAHAAPYSYCYVERASHQTIPEHRLAIVEGSAWVVVRVGVGGDSAKLLLGARVRGCSPDAYTTKVPITHPLALLHYSCGQGGYYAVAIAPPSSMVCAERSSTWQLWHPALEAALDAHCSDLSNVARIAGALNVLVDKMREGHFEGSLQLLSRYAASSVLRRRAYRCASQRGVARACLASHLAHHLLLVLDELLQIATSGGRCGYIYPVERGCAARRGARGNWASDVIALTGCVRHLYRVAGNEEIPLSPSETLELALFSRWERLTHEIKCTGPSSYSKRQLRYLNRVASELVRCKRSIVYESHSTFRANLIQVTSVHLESIEDLIHIMAIILDQARDSYMNNINNRNIGEFDRELTIYRSKKWNKLKDYYDASSACLIDAVRRDKDLQLEDDETSLMSLVLHWLYKGAKEDKKYLGPVLKPYLDDLFTSSLENSWFLEDFDAKNCDSELDGLKEYCLGVHEGFIEPCMGLLGAAKKHAWAKAVVDFVDRHRHTEFRLIFPTGDGLAVSYPLKIPSRREHSSARFLTLSRRDKAEAKLRLAKRCVVNAFHDALVGERFQPKNISRHGSTDEILASVKNGNFWRTSKPDIIPSASNTLEPKSRRKHRPATIYGFPEISITNQSDVKTLRRKYHTLRSLVYSDQVDVKEMRRRPRSAGSTVKNKEPLTRPSLLETMDFINSVKDALCVEESGASDIEDNSWCVEDEWVLSHVAPLNVIADKEPHSLHLLLADVILCAIRRGCFTMLQELCVHLNESEGALFALHRLARASRARSTERADSTWKLPDTIASNTVQQYRARPPDYTSSDEHAPPVPRRSTSTEIIKRYPKITGNDTIGITNPIYDIKPKDKLVKRTKSLSRSISIKSVDINLTLGRKKTNDVATVIEGDDDKGFDMQRHFRQRYNGGIVGDSYRINRINIE
ncbi:unnamed protein product [Colias eurytheme]|nr:unnamed protein product [Colias eurytheme]